MDRFEFGHLMPLFRFADVGSLGYIPDLPAHDLSQAPLAWSYVRNCAFPGGMAERVKGYGSGFGTVQQIPYFLLSATQTGGTNYVIAGGTSKVYSYTGSTATDISKSATTYGATADTRWTGGIFTGFVVVNEPSTDPQYCAISSLGSANALATLTNWPASTKCKVLRPFKYFLVAGYTTESSTDYPYKVRWSNSAVPGALPTSWTASSTNDAGSVDLSEDDGEIVDMYPIGDQMAIFRRGAIWLMRWIGGNDSANNSIMAFNRVQSSAASGMMANNCAALVPGRGLCVLSESDVYLFNGTSAESVIDNRARRWLFANIDAANRKRSFVVNHAEASEVWICFPSSGSTSCDLALVWNYASNTIGQRDLPTATCGLNAFVTDGTGTTIDGMTGTPDGLSGVIDSLGASATSRRTVIGSAAQKLYVIGIEVDADGSTLTAELTREGIDFGEPERAKLLRALWPRFDGQSGQALEITVGSSMWPDEGYTYSAAQAYTIGTSRKIDCDRSGRFFALRIRSTSGGVWRLRSLEADIAPLGMW